MHIKFGKAMVSGEKVISCYLTPLIGIQQTLTTAYVYEKLMLKIYEVFWAFNQKHYYSHNNWLKAHMKLLESNWKSKHATP